LIAKDPAANPVKFSAVNMPAGLTMTSTSSGDTSVAIISGKLASDAHTGSSYSITVTATDTVTNENVSQTFAWNVAQPTLTLSNPGDQSGYDGDSISLT